MKSMKKIYLSAIVLLAAVSSQAQVPQAFSYQAVIRNSSNALVANQTVSERISLIKDSATGTVVYSESQSVKTNANGLVSLQIGTGNVLSGSFSGINWATGTYFIKTETDPTGGSNYTLTNTTQLLSVPYALQAGSTPSLEYPDGLTNAATVVIGKLNSYTVPSGKNFYIQSFESNYNTLGLGFKIDNDSIVSGQYNTPVLIIGPNKKVSFFDTSSVIIGFLVDETVTATTQNLTKGNYVVPQGKQFVLFDAYGIINASTLLIFINGVALNPGGFYNLNRNGIPTILSSGTVISGTAIINGYLR